MVVLQKGTQLTLSVEAVEFDTIACSLCIKGRNIQENQYVKVVNEMIELHLVIIKHGTVVLNSRDRPGNVWLPKISHFYNPP